MGAPAIVAAPWAYFDVFRVERYCIKLSPRIFVFVFDAVPYLIRNRPIIDIDKKAVIP